eukprot:4643360-Pleurochrysis_carterae.AAC.1
MRDATVTVGQLKNLVELPFLTARSDWPTRLPNLNHARLHLPLLNTIGQGEQRRRGASSPARWLRCGGAAGRRRPCAHGGKEAWSGARALR